MMEDCRFRTDVAKVLKLQWKDSILTANPWLSRHASGGVLSKEGEGNNQVLFGPKAYQRSGVACDSPAVPPPTCTAGNLVRDDPTKEISPLRSPPNPLEWDL